MKSWYVCALVLLVAALSASGLSETIIANYASASSSDSSGFGFMVSGPGGGEGGGVLHPGAGIHSACCLWFAPEKTLQVHLAGGGSDFTSSDPWGFVDFSAEVTVPPIIPGLLLPGQTVTTWGVGTYYAEFYTCLQPNPFYFWSCLDFGPLYLQGSGPLVAEATWTANEYGIWLTSVEMHSVPEPATTVLLTSGIAGLGLRRIRRGVRK